MKEVSGMKKRTRKLLNLPAPAEPVPELPSKRQKLAKAILPQIKH
jgi:hypothetical protein